MSLIQREGRPALDLKPSADDTAEFNSGAACQEDYGDVGMNPLNHPVPVRKGQEPVNGWMTVASDIVSEGEGFSKGSGGEKR